jgi:hypothetical protein
MIRTKVLQNLQILELHYARANWYLNGFRRYNVACTNENADMNLWKKIREQLYVAQI